MTGRDTAAPGVWMPDVAGRDLAVPGTRVGAASDGV